MQIRSLLSLLLLLFLIYACSSDYSPPVYSHHYTTNTQTQHQITGIELNYFSSSGVSSAILQTMFLTGFFIECYVDGRLVYKVNTAKKEDSRFIQLPPGKHQIDIIKKKRGATTLGFNTRSTRSTIIGEIEAGQIASIHFDARGKVGYDDVYRFKHYEIMND